MSGGRTDPSWAGELVEQIDWHWKAQLRPRLDGLTDDEYWWEPAANSWTVHPRTERRSDLQDGKGDLVIDFAFDPPEPAPVRTIAWLLGHIASGVLAMRVHGHFGGPPADPINWAYADTAAEALDQVDTQYAAWTDGLRGWVDAGTMSEPIGDAEAEQFASSPRASIVLHINRELIHHGAEIALLRDLYANRPLTG